MVVMSSPSPFRERGAGGEVCPERSEGSACASFVLPALALLLAACAPHHLASVAPVAPTDPLERCHQLYIAAGSDGPKLLAVDAMIVDSTTDPPLRCGPLRSAHPRLKSSE